MLGGRLVKSLGVLGRKKYSKGALSLSSGILLRVVEILVEEVE